MKAAIRKHVGAYLRTVPPADIAALSREAALRLTSSPAFAASTAVSCFLSMPTGEVQTAAVVDAAKSSGKRLYVPSVVGPHPSDMKMLHVAPSEDPDSFPKTKWAIPQPPELYSLAAAEPREDLLGAWPDDATRVLVIVPGVAFDSNGRRLGHGKGYYDTFIRSLRVKHGRLHDGIPAPLLIAIAFDFQVVAAEAVASESVAAEPELVIRADGLRAPSGFVFPMEPHDELVDVIVTPSRTIVCTERGARGFL